MNYLREFWKNPLQTDGRCSQKEFANIYWLSFFIFFIPIIGWIYVLLFIIPSFCLAVRRFHDLGLSGAYVITLFIPGINFFMIFYLTFAQGKLDTPFTQTPNSYNINYTPTQYIQPIQNIQTTQYTQPMPNPQYTQKPKYNTNSSPIEKDLMDILCEETMPLYEKLPSYKSNIQNTNISTSSQSTQSQNIQEPIKNYKEKYIENNFHTDNIRNITDNFISPEESNTKLILCSLIFCILSLFLFNWPGSIGLEWISIICGSIPIYYTYKESHSLPIVPFGCIIVSLFLFLISLYLI